MKQSGILNAVVGGAVRGGFNPRMELFSSMHIPFSGTNANAGLENYLRRYGAPVNNNGVLNCSACGGGGGACSACTACGGGFDRL